MIERPLVTACAGLPLSVALTVKLDVAAGPVGVPEITPLEELSASPAGSEPEAIDHVYGDIPPDDCSVWLYATPSEPLPSELVVIASVEAFTVIDSGALACRAGLPLSVA